MNSLVIKRRPIDTGSCQPYLKVEDAHILDYIFDAYCVIVGFSFSEGVLIVSEYGFWDVAHIA